MRRFSLLPGEPSVKRPRTPRRPFSGRLVLVRAFLARPSAGGAREGGAHAAVDDGLGAAEDGALEGARGDHLAPRGVAVLALRRVLVVKERPDLLEELLAEEAGDQ